VTEPREPQKAQALERRLPPDALRAARRLLAELALKYLLTTRMGRATSAPRSTSSSTNDQDSTTDLLPRRTGVRTK
jgi:hypothetical protein